MPSTNDAVLVSRRAGKLGFVHAPVVLLATLLCCTGCGRERREPPPLFSSKALAARVEALRPDLTAVLGGDVGPARCRVSSREAMAAIAARHAHNGEDTEGFRDALGLLDPETEVIHLCPRNFGGSERRWDGVSLERILDVVLVHELAHLWQQRRYDLTRFYKGATADEELWARVYLVEGHAQYVARQVARKRGLQEAFDRLAQFKTGSADPARRRGPYWDGMRFVAEEVRARGFVEASDHLFANPPRRVEAFRPIRRTTRRSN